MIDPQSYLDNAERGGAEHRVWHDERHSRYFKFTYPGLCGCHMVAKQGLPSLVDATPQEYIERLLLQNTLFADDIRLHGIAMEPKGMVLVTSQPNIVGTEPSYAEIETFFAKLWFKPLPGLNAANPGSLAFYRELDELAVFDAHRGNLVRDHNGIILPIDLILVRADVALQQALAPLLL